MAYLVSDDVLTRSGYPTDHADAAKAVAVAESIISAYTGLTFYGTGGSASTEQVIRQKLEAKTYYLSLPFDVVAVASILPNASAYTPELVQESKAKALRWLDADDEPQVFSAGWYKVTCTRGLPVTDLLNKIASLYVGWYIGLSDPERSRYANFAQGDISGAMRIDDTPVPEATALLRSAYPKPPKVALV